MMEIQSESWKLEVMIIPPNRSKSTPKHATNHPHHIHTQIWSKSRSGKSTQSNTETPLLSFFPFLQSVKCDEIRIQPFIRTIQINHPNAATTHQYFTPTTQNSISFRINPQSLKLKELLSYHHLYPFLTILIHYLPPIPTTRRNHTPFHQSPPFSPHSHQQTNTNHISPPMNPLQRIHPPHT